MNFQNLLNGIWPFLLSVGLIALNEMGDKSQFLAMAFAAKMRLHKVLIGIFIAVFVLNALAVAAGTLLANVPGWHGCVQFASALLFLFFGLWSLRGEEKDDGTSKQKIRSYGEITAVFVSFFFSEMGDKTQLVTISLAARYPDEPLMILFGTTLGMLLADGIGIFAGAVAHRKLPGEVLNLISAVLFFLFGMIGIWSSFTSTFHFSFARSMLLTFLIGAITAAAGTFIYRKSKRKAHI